MKFQDVKDGRNLVIGQSIQFQSHQPEYKVMEMVDMLIDHHPKHREGRLHAIYVKDGEHWRNVVAYASHDVDKFASDMFGHSMGKYITRIEITYFGKLYELWFRVQELDHTDGSNLDTNIGPDLIEYLVGTLNGRY